MGEERSRSSNQTCNGKLLIKKKEKLKKTNKTENRIVEIRRGSLGNSFKPPKCELCR